ncbi:MAG: hypothetical protein IJD47_02225, partial [Clostridia bacterium]|nr:hypothetical protein [Clostridia bacterium]
SGSNGATPPDPDNCNHTWTDATCTEPKTCTLCWTTQGEALGHTEPNAEGLCDRCGKILDSKTTHAGTQADPYSVADALKIGATLNGGRTEKVFVQGEITNVGTVKSNTYRQGMIIKDSSGQTLTINTANPKSSSDLDVKVGDTILLEGYIRSTGGTVDMGSKDYTTYTYYSIVTGGQTHTHSFGQATCTQPATCSCGATQGTALGHTTTNGTCTRCGIVVGGQGGQTSQASKSIDLTSVSNKVSASANLLAFASGELKVSINKASATSDLKDYTESGYSARVYFGATLTVEYPQMTKIVINCDDYTSGGKVYYEGFDGMEVAGATITRDNLTITIEFANPVDTFTSGSVTSQTRILSIDVYTGDSTGGDKPVDPPVDVTDPMVEDFKSAVANIQSATTMQQKFDAIKVAANAYNSLNDTQKAQVTTELEQLKTAIADYNASATTQNTNSINVLYWTAQVSLIVTMAVALVLLKKVF